MKKIIYLFALTSFAFGIDPGEYASLIEKAENVIIMGHFHLSPVQRLK